MYSVVYIIGRACSFGASWSLPPVVARPFTPLGNQISQIAPRARLQMRSPRRSTKVFFINFMCHSVFEYVGLCIQFIIL